jgi:ankyrin repeat protein
MSNEFLEAVRRGDVAAVRSALVEDASLARLTLPAAPGEEHLKGATPLHVAAREGHSALVPLLVAHGADLEARTHEGRTALHDSIEWGQRNAEKALIAAGARIDICAAAILGRADEVRAMLDADPKLVNERSTSLSPLGWAAFGNQAGIAAELIERGAKMDDGELHCAAMVGHVEVAEVLMAHGADPNALAKESGANALHAAAHLRYTGDATRFVQMMLEAGADPTIRARDGRTALEIAEAGAREQASAAEGDRSSRNFAGLIGLLRAAMG